MAGAGLLVLELIGAAAAFRAGFSELFGASGAFRDFRGSSELLGLVGAFGFGIFSGLLAGASRASGWNFPELLELFGAPGAFGAPRVCWCFRELLVLFGAFGAAWTTNSSSS
jgi:hypothetical protein